ncbi:MAG TPA: S9 family peptidase [Gammaproteobacteria bacterium]|nr:S9 family peptidase [Gammaproteobacteria bacterium]
MNESLTRTLPFGGWPSPVSAELVAGKSLRLGQPQVYGEAIYWTETRPQEGGRNTVVRWRADEGFRDLLPASYSAASRVNGYGGGVFATDGERLWFVDKNDQCIHETRSGVTRRVCDESAFADLVFDRHRERLLAVREQGDGPDAVTTLVAIDIADGRLATLREGSDFYSSPRISPDGRRLAWLEWRHPDMPWDRTELWLAEFDDNGRLREPRCIAREAAIVQPEWRGNGELVFAADWRGWWNLYLWRDGECRCLAERDADFALPHWVFGMRAFGVRGDGSIVAAFTRDGTWRVAEIDADAGTLRELELPYTQVEHVHAAGDVTVLLAANAAQTTTVVRIERDRSRHELRRAAEIDLDPVLLLPPEPVSFPTGDGETAHGLYYAPANPACEGPANGAPPLLVKVHGGPTAATSSALDLKIRYWTSRGFAVLDVNYRGSTGYGRAYRESLYGRWGLADVEDCVNGAKALAERGLADPARLLISGSSAGGFTTLAALTFHDVFAAGASYYGIGDLAAAMRDTEKFESRYGDRLIGPLPECEQLWRERSPLFHAGRLRKPVIFFQGLEDRIVPPSQSERMYAAARANGVRTYYIPFANEGHGFRGAATIATALAAEYAFYCSVLGIAAAEPLPDLESLG